MKNFEKYKEYLVKAGGFPSFKAGTMYKGMATGRRYTLEELGL